MLSSLLKLNSDSGSFVFCFLEDFFADATGWADLDADAVDLTTALPLEAGGTVLDPPAVDLDAAGFEAVDLTTALPLEAGGTVLDPPAVDSTA